MLDSNFAVLGLVCIFLAAFAAVLAIATVIVMAKAYLCKCSQGFKGAPMRSQLPSDGGSQWWLPLRGSPCGTMPGL